jgi:glucose-1-phosphate adenylyltransferase
VILDNCDIGRHRVPEDAVIGYDLELDRLHYHVTDSGIVVVGEERSSVNVGALLV